MNNGTEFIIVFTIAEKIKGDLYKYFVAKSFKLNSFNQDEAYEEINTTKLNDGEDIKIINSFLLNSEKVFANVFIKKKLVEDIFI